MARLSRLPIVKLIAPFLLFCVAGCSVPETPTDIHDPYESVNRSVHAFNKGLDRTLLRPVSQAYGTVLPAPIRNSVSNLSNNFRAPSLVVNDALQGKADDAVHNGFRFLLNSSLGVLGLFDVALSFGLEERYTDFGETLAVWGTPEGAYVELPVLGPYTERSAVGWFVDVFTNPIGYAFPSNDLATARIVTYSGLVVNTRYLLTESIDSILYDSADSYAQLRLFYLESSRFNLGEGEASAIDTEIYDDLYGDIFDE